MEDRFRRLSNIVLQISKLINIESEVTHFAPVAFDGPSVG